MTTPPWWPRWPSYQCQRGRLVGSVGFAVFSADYQVRPARALWTAAADSRGDVRRPHRGRRGSLTVRQLISLASALNRLRSPAR
jgi:hypothetical protein